MKWFDRWFDRQCRKAWENNRNNSKSDHFSPAVYAIDAGLGSRTSISFTLYPAAGGWVIQHSKYTRDRDGEGPSLTIVNHGEELGKALEHVISLEALR
jgi:hypothetical protein